MADNGDNGEETNGEESSCCEDLLEEQNDILNDILAEVEIITELVEPLEFFMNTVFGYAYIYIPLAIIVIMLWWFFKQFLYQK